MGAEGPGPRIEELVDRHLADLYRFGYRLTGSQVDAEDLVQETFLIAQQKLHQLRDPDRALAWLSQILRRCHSSQFRQKPATEPIAIEEIADDSWDEPDILDEFDAEGMLEILDRLPEEYKVPLVLFYFRELRYREIAEVLDCPIGTVMSRLARGKALLRSRMVPERVQELG